MSEEITWGIATGINNNTAIVFIVTAITTFIILYMIFVIFIYFIKFITKSGSHVDVENVNSDETNDFEYLPKYSMRDNTILGGLPEYDAQYDTIITLN